MESAPLKAREKYAEELVANFDSRFFKVLSEPVRVQILKCLILKGRADIAAIAEELPQDRSVISRHLKFMSEAGIVCREKISRHVYYEVDAKSFRDKLAQIVEKITECLSVCCPFK